MLLLKNFKWKCSMLWEPQTSTVLWLRWKTQFGKIKTKFSAWLKSLRGKYVFVILVNWTFNINIWESLLPRICLVGWEKPNTAGKLSCELRWWKIMNLSIHGKWTWDGWAVWQIITKCFLESHWISHLQEQFNVWGNMLVCFLAKS